MHHGTDHGQGARGLALGLGWFSIGLGLTELLAPRSLARAIGMPDANDGILRAFGAREVANGLAILAEPDRAAWLWSRVGGDGIDLSYLAAGLADDNNDSGRVALALASVLGVTALDVICARQLNGHRQPASEQVEAERSRAVRVEQVTTVNRPVHEVYQFWRRFESFPRFMQHIESVQVLDARRSRWRATAPAGRTVEWTAELLEDRQDEWIAWRSIEGSQIQNSGSVRFTPAPGGRGTEVRVQLQYSPPAGAVGRSIAWLFGQDPEAQIHHDLHRFKQLMETGEIPLSDGPAMWRPAQPATDPEEVRSLAGVRQ
jgi:uncharacterized membrane protein